MKKQNQLRVLENLKLGKYKVINDKIFALSGNCYKEMNGYTFQSGYKQFHLSMADEKLKVSAYCHQIVYLAYFGEYDENLVIDHLDRNNRNNMPLNLEPKTHKQNIENSNKRKRNESGVRSIRNKEIKEIRKLHAEGRSQSYIARELDLNRLSVRYTIKNIETGAPLKYEHDY